MENSINLSNNEVKSNFKLNIKKIHRLFLVLMLIFYFIKTGHSQFSAQISSGVDASSVNYEGLSTINPKTILGYHGEFNLCYEIGERVNLIIATQFTSRGFLIENSNGSGYRRNYLDFQPELSIEPFNNMEFGAGIYYGLLISSQYRASNEEWVNLLAFQHTDLNDLGLSLLFRQSIGNVVLYVRWKHGIRNLNKIVYTDNKGTPIANSRERNRQLQVGVGYRFNLIKKTI